MPAPRRIASEPSHQGEASGTPLEIVVPFTTPELTQAALDQADQLVRRLDGCLRVILIQAVPQPFPLDRPPVAPDHLENAMHSLLSSSRTYGEVYLARDVEQTWKRLLRRKLVIVIASRKRLWRTPEERLARMLERNGHEIVLIYPSETNYVKGHPFSCLPDSYCALDYGVHEPTPDSQPNSWIL